MSRFQRDLVLSVPMEEIEEATQVAAQIRELVRGFASLDSPPANEADDGIADTELALKQLECFARTLTDPVAKTGSGYPAKAVTIKGRAILEVKLSHRQLMLLLDSQNPVEEEDARTGNFLVTATLQEPVVCSPPLEEFGSFGDLVSYISEWGELPLDKEKFSTLVAEQLNDHFIDWEEHLPPDQLAEQLISSLSAVQIQEQQTFAEVNLRYGERALCQIPIPVRDCHALLNVDE